MEYILPKQRNIFRFPVFQSLILGLKIYAIYCSKNLTCFLWTSGFQNPLIHTDFDMFVDE